MKICYEFHQSQDSSIDIVTACVLDDLVLDFQQCQVLLSSTYTFRPALGLTVSPTQFIFLQAHRVSCEVGHTSVCSAKVKNVWNCTSNPHAP